MLSCLPQDVLRHLCLSLLQHSPDPDTPEYLRPFSNIAEIRQSFCSTSAHQALRSCSQRLKLISDSIRTSIRFKADRQAAVGPYLPKLPALTAVCIEYNTLASDILSSLAALHRTSPGLTALKLEVTPWLVSCRAGRLDTAILPWGGTLKRLELHKMSCFSGIKDGGSSGLRFLSQMSALQVLVLVEVSPTLAVQDIEGCTSLLKLTLSWNPAKTEHCLDPSNSSSL
ncbi:MAG: hypothetical protein WDW38_005210 [Sanguina aurantia]